jgi:hypothetical protein
MPTVAVYVNGMTAGTAGHNPNPSVRGEVKGWSRAAVRRHTRWLYSVDSSSLDGAGFAATLTMRDTPDDAAAFHRARRAFLMRLERAGLLRNHWVVEWQRRGTPHFHMALYWPADAAPADLAAARGIIVRAWLAVAAGWGAGEAAQVVKSIDGPLGWLQYLSKHAARGVEHYQRSGKPAGWEKSGRLWGYGGEWPVTEPLKLQLSREGYWEFRRLVRAWRIADARAALAVARDDAARRSAVRRLKGARQMLACHDRRLSEVRGISEWVPEDLAQSFVLHLAAAGYDVR